MWSFPQPRGLASSPQASYQVSFQLPKPCRCSRPAAETCIPRFDRKRRRFKDLRLESSLIYLDFPSVSARKRRFLRRFKVIRLDFRRQAPSQNLPTVLESMNDGLGSLEKRKTHEDRRFFNGFILISSHRHIAALDATVLFGAATAEEPGDRAAGHDVTPREASQGDERGDGSSEAHERVLRRAG